MEAEVDGRVLQEEQSRGSAAAAASAASAAAVPDTHAHLQLLQGM